MDKFEIKASLISNHKFNETKNLKKVIDNLKNNKIISMISDAGTPGISDPGAILINECLKHNIEITPLPGPSAVTTAVSISGFSEKYLFYGFFPDKEKMIQKELDNLSSLNFCLVFFISPKKINKIIPHLNNYFKDRKILICREISKYHEEYIRDSIKNLSKIPIFTKGEVTIVISEDENLEKKLTDLEESDKNQTSMISPATLCMLCLSLCMCHLRPQLG